MLLDNVIFKSLFNDQIRLWKKPDILSKSGSFFILESYFFILKIILSMISGSCFLKYGEAFVMLYLLSGEHVRG